MSLDEKQSFLERWSRRKLGSAKETAAPKPVASSASGRTPAPGGAAGLPQAPMPKLPSIDSLHGLASEYRDFLHPDVDEKLRQFALKKLFHDPHFNVMDGLDTYIDDYSKPDPVPAAMLEGLMQANRQLFPREAAAGGRPGESESGGIAAAGAAGGPEAQSDAGADTPAPTPGPERKT